MKTSGKSSLIQSIETLTVTSERVSGFPCKVSRLLDALTKEEQEALTGLIDNAQISIRRIAELLLEHEHVIGVDVLRRHRLRQKPGGCKCQRNPLP